MFARKHSKPQSRIDCLIGAGTVVEGNIVFTGGLRIDGKVKGNVMAGGEQPGTLVLSEQARVDCEVQVSHAVINGAVTGPVRAVEYLELQPKAHVTGDVHYDAIEVQKISLSLRLMDSGGRSFLAALINRLSMTLHTLLIRL